MAETFDPWSVVFGALIGAIAGAFPSAILFYLEGRRARDERIRQARMAAVDAAVGRVGKMVDHAFSRLTNAPGVLPHDALGFYSADLSLIPDRDAVEELVSIVNGVMAGEGGYRADPDATMTRLAVLQSQVGESARVTREAIAKGDRPGIAPGLLRRLGLD